MVVFGGEIDSSLSQSGPDAVATEARVSPQRREVPFGLVGVAAAFRGPVGRGQIVLGLGDWAKERDVCDPLALFDG